MSRWLSVARYVAARGLTTSMIPADCRAVQIEVDVVVDQLVIAASTGIDRHWRSRPALSPRQTSETRISPAFALGPIIPIASGA